MKTPDTKNKASLFSPDVVEKVSPSVVEKDKLTFAGHALQNLVALGLLYQEDGERDLSQPYTTMIEAPIPAFQARSPSNLLSQEAYS